MIAYWMAELLISPGTNVDSKDFESFRKRLMNKVLGAPAGGEMKFTDAAGQALFELSLELVRVAEFPRRPSRLHSLFLWPDAALARQYHAGAEYASVYEVTVLAQRNVFVGDFDLITYYPSSPTLAAFMERARTYWSGGGQGTRKELVLDGVIEVTSSL